MFASNIPLELINKRIRIFGKSISPPIKHIGSSTISNSLLSINRDCCFEVCDWIFVSFKSNIDLWSLDNWTHLFNDYWIACILVFSSIYQRVEVRIGSSICYGIFGDLKFDTVALWNRHWHIERYFIKVISRSIKNTWLWERNIMREAKSES